MSNNGIPLVQVLKCDWHGGSKCKGPVIEGWTFREEPPRTLCDNHGRMSMRTPPALPEPAKADGPADDYDLVHAVRCSCARCKPATPPPARCAPGCVPAAPCRTEGVCPVFAEERVSERMSEAWGAKGIAADPPARRHTPPPLRHEDACIAGWNGRAPRG